MDFKRQIWNRERFVIKYLEIFFLTLAAKWAAMIHSKYLKPFLLQFQYLNWNEYLECILDASNQKSSSFTPWSTFRLNWRPLIGSSQFREFSHVPIDHLTRLFGMNRCVNDQCTDQLTISVRPSWSNKCLDDSKSLWIRLWYALSSL